MSTATQPAKLANWNSVRPTCACGRKSYCDNSCNTFAKQGARAELADLALGMSFDDWKELYGGAR